MHGMSRTYCGDCDADTCHWPLRTVTGVSVIHPASGTPLTRPSEELECGHPGKDWREVGWAIDAVGKRRRCWPCHRAECRKGLA